MYQYKVTGQVSGKQVTRTVRVCKGVENPRAVVAHYAAAHMGMYDVIVSGYYDGKSHGSSIVLAGACESCR